MVPTSCQLSQALRESGQYDGDYPPKRVRKSEQIGFGSLSWRTYE